MNPVRSHNSVFVLLLAPQHDYRGNGQVPRVQPTPSCYTTQDFPLLLESKVVLLKHFFERVSILFFLF